VARLGDIAMRRGLMPIHVLRMPEKDWPEAWLDLIEALRAYVEVEECLWEEFRREELEAGGGVLTEEASVKFEELASYVERFKTLLADLEGHEIDPTLRGLLR
jgi:hypothetical protein